MADSAECTLFEFLDGPEAQPSREWVAAATNRDRLDSQSPRAEQALLLGQEAEDTERRIAALRARPDASSRDDEVVGILSAAFNVGRDRAFECLLWASEQSGNTVPSVAEQFMARVEVLGTDAHDRQALLGLLAKLAGRTDVSMS